MRAVRVLGMCLVGTEAELVTVEARFEARERTRLEVSISGLPDPVIRESRGRLLAALDEHRLHLPQGRLFVNLFPAGMRKAGEALDLPLALGAAAAVGHLTPGSLARTLFLGELGIDGRLHPVPGGLAAARAAVEQGITRLVAAEATAREAALWPGMHAFAARDLAEVVGWVSSGNGLAPVAAVEASDEAAGAVAAAAQALDAVRGQGEAKRALAAAAAGGHGLLFLGPPGTGKSLLARALHGLLPPPTSRRSSTSRASRPPSVAGRAASRASGRSALRTTRRATRASWAAARRRSRARSRSRTPGSCSSTSCPSSGARRWKRCASRSRAGAS
jgi:magnesium chelatase family protein